MYITSLWSHQVFRIRLGEAENTLLSTWYIRFLRTSKLSYPKENLRQSYIQCLVNSIIFRPQDSVFITAPWLHLRQGLRCTLQRCLIRHLPFHDGRPSARFCPGQLSGGSFPRSGRFRMKFVHDPSLRTLLPPSKYLTTWEWGNEVRFCDGVEILIFLRQLRSNNAAMIFVNVRYADIFKTFKLLSAYMFA